MTRLVSRIAGGLAGGAAVALLFAGASGCSEIEDVEPGPPVLLKFELYAVPITHASALRGDLLDTSTPVPAVAPLTGASALFDRILDGGKLETVNSDGTITSKPGAVSGTYDGGDLALDFRWMSTGVADTDPGLKPGPSIDMWATKSVMWGMTKVNSIALPGGSMVTLTLNKGTVTGKKGEQFSGKETHTFMTSDFKASTTNIPKDAATGMPKPQAATFTVKITFTGTPDPSSANQITVMANGASVPITVTPDTAAAGANILNVKAMAATGWAAGTTHTITVGKAATDVYGKAMPADFTATLVTM